MLSCAAARAFVASFEPSHIVVVRKRCGCIAQRSGVVPIGPFRGDPEVVIFECPFIWGAAGAVRPPFVEFGVKCFVDTGSAQPAGQHSFARMALLVTTFVQGDSELQTCTFEGPRRFKHHRNSTRRTPESEKAKMEPAEGEISAKFGIVILWAPSLRAEALRSPLFLGLDPYVPHFIIFLICLFLCIFSISFHFSCFFFFIFSLLFLHSPFHHFFLKKRMKLKSQRPLVPQRPSRMTSCTDGIRPSAPHGLRSKRDMAKAFAAAQPNSTDHRLNQARRASF